MLDRLRYSLRAALRRGRVDQELSDELAFHVERETDRLVAAGVSPSDARRRAIVAIGGVETVKEAHRDGRGTRWIHETLGDARYALRGLRRNRALAAAAIGTFALAIGATTAIYTAVDAVLVRPLPFAAPERLVAIGENNPDFKWHMQDAAPANLFDWRARVAAFQDVMGYNAYPESATLLRDGVPALMSVHSVTGNFFSVLGVPAQFGRTFRLDETWSSGANVVMISDHLWRERFGADRAIIGTTAMLDGKPCTIVGIAPPGFRFPEPGTDIWRPFGWRRENFGQIQFRRAHWVRAVARLAPAATIAQASAQLTAVAQQLKHEYPATNRVMDAELAPLHRFLIGDSRLPLLVVLGSVALLLLVACANVGNLLLARAAAREREIALRVAIGASGSRLVRQSLVDSLVLACLGGAAGLALGWWATRTLGALMPARMLPVHELTMRWSIVWLVVVVTTLSGVAFGVVPAAWASRRDPSDALKAGGRGAEGGARANRWGRRLAVAEVAVALVLSVAAGLLVRSYSMLTRVDNGFDGHGVTTMTLSLPSARYDSSAKIIAFYDALLAQVRALPGVADAALTTQLPLNGPGWSSGFSLEGASAGHYSQTIVHRQLTPDYFRTMRVRLLRGRWFTNTDRGAPPVAVINDALARAVFGGQAPIGQQITFDVAPNAQSVWRTIVGVVGGERQLSPAAPVQPEVFEPLAQALSRGFTLVVRSSVDVGPALRGVVSSLDPRLAIVELRTMREIEDRSMARDRFVMALVSLFGIVALVLAIVGVYGVVAQIARGRRREMGIRIALGASGSSVRWLVVRHGLTLGATGAAIGVVAALAATRSLAKLLFGVAPTDALTFVAVVIALLAAAGLASWIPGARLARVDPASTLRED